MAKKDRQQKKALKEQNATPQNIARRQARAEEKKKQEEFIARSKGLMSAALASLVIATFALLYADIFKPSFAGGLKMFANGLTVAAGGSLLVSRRYAAAGSRRWLLFGGIGAIVLGIISFVGYMFI